MLKYDDKNEILTKFQTVKNLIKHHCVTPNFISVQRATIQLSKYTIYFAIHVIPKSGTSKIQHKYIIAAKENARTHFIGCWDFSLNCDWLSAKHNKPHCSRRKTGAHQGHHSRRSCFELRASRCGISQSQIRNAGIHGLILHLAYILLVPDFGKA